MVDVSDDVLDSPLWTDGGLCLSRGRLRGPRTPRSVLLLAPVSEHPAPEMLSRLEHEYSLAPELQPAWAARPIALMERRGRTTLVLEDSGGEPLDGLLGKPLELDQFLRIAIGLCAAVGHLHGRGLIHKDIKPAHVLVKPSTGEVWLTGFGIAVRLRRERQSPEPPESIAGTLAYMAPEQTGRMNRSVDSRSDLYSLGVTLYEMLTGSLPFTAYDPMGWVHSHIARRPVPPLERREDVPGVVSGIVMKLLAKTPEERYQTAAGAERDLRRCLAEWETQHRIDEFALGEHDIPDRLLIPEKLYGRESEICALLTTFDRVVAGGRPELVLVSGYAGIGKSSVVNELHKSLVQPRGLFASGKFDQYKRDIPYATLAQAFQSLVRALLMKREGELSQWRAALREALDPNGQLIVDLVPELKLIIGEQPPVPPLSPQENQGRFKMVFRRFISVFARPDHPLALFLDDLQWLDAATLDLLEDLMTRSELQHLMLIGAYRDNEVDSTHPLVRKLEAIRNGGAPVQEVRLAPLAPEDVGQFTADALRCGPARAAPLAKLVHEKTAGNPFFVIQFLSTLAEEGLLAFDHDAARWSWDLGRMHAKRYTANVVDLMVGKLSRLPAVTQEGLQQLACLGNRAYTGTLALVRGTSEEQVHVDLWEAVHLELIERVDGVYRFVHDRVQEAAYSLIPEQSRAERHLRIGRLLAAHTPPEKREEVIFEIVNHLNRGVSLMTSQNEREELAELNLIAGRRARSSNAYSSALKYLVAGAALLDDRWERRHDLISPMEFHRAECEFLTGELAAAEQRLTTVASHAADMIELATVACLRMDLYMALGQSARAVAVCLDYLRQLGHEWSPRPGEEEIRREWDRICSQVGRRAVEELIDLPFMSDPVSLATLDVLTKAIIPAWFTNRNLGGLVTCRAVSLSLELGNSDASCIAYEHLAMLAGPWFGDYKSGAEFGRLGYELVEKRGLTRFRARTYMFFGCVIMPWTAHVRAGRDLVRRAFDDAYRAGDVFVAVGSGEYLITNLLAGGDPLTEVGREAENAHEFARKSQFGLIIDNITAQLGLIRTLRGLTPRFGCFDDDSFDEARFEHHLASHPVFAVTEFWYWTRKTQARFLAGDLPKAVEAASRAHQLVGMSPSFFETAECHFYGALSRAAFWDSASPGEKQQHFEVLVAHHKQLEAWAELCPENFENRAALVGAEIARIEGRVLDAEHLYEKAIRSAHGNGFIHNEAVACEIAARFYAARGLDRIANVYLRDARYSYLRWGADGKVRQFDQLHPHLAADEPAPDARRTTGTPIEHLDLATVLKLSQAVSGEIVLEKLIDTLLRTAIEHAGAERGVLILPRSDGLSVEAEANTRGDSVTVRLREAPVAGSEMPESVVHYTARTQESVLLDDAFAPGPFSDDAYIRQRRVRSVLCLPLVKQGRLVALLYLENSLAPNVFTPSRTTVLKVLASQAAMGLESSHLYRDLQEREAKIRRLVDANIVGVVISHLDGQVLEANDAYLRIVGYTREDLVSGRLRWTDLTPPEWQAAGERAVAQLKESGTCEMFEKEYLRSDGTRVPALVTAAVIGGSPTQAVAFVLDLTERKRAEEERERLRQAHAELARISRVTTLGELTASLAHEIKQPIAAIVANAGACIRWLGREAPDLGEAREAVARISKDASRAGEIMNRVGALYRKGAARREPVDVNEVARETVALLRSEASGHFVSIRTELAPELPEVSADRVQLQQVFMNLMLNGIEAMRQTTGELRIESRLADDGKVLISVSDEGVGLPPEADEIFQAFFTTKAEGTGMGLSISRSIVTAHGGRLWASRSQPRGATFQFTLPIRTSEQRSSSAGR